MENLHTEMKPLSKSRAIEVGATLRENVEEAPIRILQIGEGNFLRGFLDWMVQRANEIGAFTGRVVMTPCRKTGRDWILKLENQDLLYTVITRGILDGQDVHKSDLISVIAKTVDPYTNWSGFLELAGCDALEFVVSNTTEAGLRYEEIPWQLDAPMLLYPARLTVFLYQRFLFFKGAKDKGLAIFPCELVERNGDSLKRFVLQHSNDWSLPHEFLDWVKECNTFLNSLVDRIVPGFPSEEAGNMWRVLGYEDKLLTCAEPYHIWAIEKQRDVENRFTIAMAGVNVQWVDDLTPFHAKKVRILNGLHTLMAPLGVLRGVLEVREALAHARIGSFIRDKAIPEIMDTLPYEKSESLSYAKSVLERFQNPYIHHQLIDITLNSIVKFRMRLLPTLVTYFQKNGVFPEGVIEGFAGLIRFYKVKKTDFGYQGLCFDKTPYPVKDEEFVLGYFSELWASYEREQLSLEALIKQVLGNEQFWGDDLNELAGLLPALVSAVQKLDPTLV